MALLEAMAQRCAVIATPVGEVPSLIAECGLSVPVANTGRLTAALLWLMRRPDTVLRLGGLARARIEQRYAAATVAEQLEREWRSLLDHDRSTRGDERGSGPAAVAGTMSMTSRSGHVRPGVDDQEHRPVPPSTADVDATVPRQRWPRSGCGRR